MSEMETFKFTSSEGVLDIEEAHIQHLDQVKFLDLSSTNTVHLPDFVYDMKNLEKLDISNTKIQWFDEKMCNLENLEILIGKNNTYKANEVPLYTFCLKSLRILDMSNSSLFYIDEYIGKLEHLEEIYMSDNQFLNVPWMFQNLKNLVVYDFRNNRIENSSINTLLSCKDEESHEDRKECNEDLRHDLHCDHFHEDPALWGRGESFRKIYTDMIGQDLDEFEDYETVPRTYRNSCYTAWLVWMIDFEEDNLLEKTILGKTIREDRYAGEYANHIKIGGGSLACWAKTTTWWWNDNLKKSPTHGAESFPEQWRDMTGFSSRVQAWLASGDFFDRDWWIDMRVERCPHLEGLGEAMRKTREVSEEKYRKFKDRIKNWKNSNYPFPDPEEVKKRIEASTTGL